MEPISIINGRAAPFRVANVDTDQIIPARFLKFKVTDGYEKFLFHDLRFDEHEQPVPDFVLNRVPDATILVSGENFGCGSSREGAVQALQHYGIKVVIAESFGPIFENNCLKNGLLPIRLPKRSVNGLLDRYERDASMISVDLPNRSVTDADGNRYTFQLDDFWHTLLMKGMDTLELTLSRMDEVIAFENRRIAEEPWLLPRLSSDAIKESPL